mmetsp:Transcript_7273/g.18373  ORF Transcript_7273/g.18373 Transcript_7273/m.18373 type:complete len:312 (+) Transcript_7273:115-1050(+)
MHRAIRAEKDAARRHNRVEQNTSHAALKALRVVCLIVRPCVRAANDGVPHVPADLEGVALGGAQDVRRRDVRQTVLPKDALPLLSGVRRSAGLAYTAARISQGIHEPSLLCEGHHAGIVWGHVDPQWSIQDTAYLDIDALRRQHGRYKIQRRHRSSAACRTTTKHYGVAAARGGPAEAVPHQVAQRRLDHAAAPKVPAKRLARGRSIAQVRVGCAIAHDCNVGTVQGTRATGIDASELALVGPVLRRHEAVVRPPAVLARLLVPAPMSTFQMDDPHRRTGRALVQKVSTGASVVADGLLLSQIHAAERDLH